MRSVYERFVLNDFLLALQKEHGIETVLEAPLFGMAGVSGINSVALAQAGGRMTERKHEPWTVPTPNPPD